MKITRLTKFDIGQMVFVLFDNSIVEAKIKFVFGGYARVVYILSGSFINGYHSYPVYEYEETEIYATRQEAVVKLKESKERNLVGSLTYLKMKICEVSRNYRQYEIDRPELKEYIGLCSAWNKKLLQIIKKEHESRKLIEWQRDENDN